MNKEEINARLSILFSLKSPLIEKQRERKEKYKGVRKNKRNKVKSDYKTNTIFSIINAKKAEILSGLQEYDFIPLDDDGNVNVHMVKKIWEYEWLSTKTDKQLANVIHSSLVSGDGYMYEGIRQIKRNINEPSYSAGAITYSKKEIVDYDGIYCEYIPWENIYFDGIDIDNSNEAVWIKDWDRNEYINSFELNPNYYNVNNELPIGRYYYIATDGNIRTDGNLNDENTITELKYYNKSKDLYIILVNGVEVYSSPIPYKHKELPFCKFEDYKLDDRFYSMGEYELLEEDEEYKDALRSLNIDVIKAQFGFTVIDPEADFDEATIEIGTNKFARISPKDISHFSPNINANTIIQAEQAADNDMIIKSGIDYRAQILGASETATKTDAKVQSARKRINLNLKLNGYSFFERLAKLRMANISLLYGQGTKNIPLKGGSINNDGIYSPLNSGYGTFIVKPSYVKGVFNVIPITESILGISSERDKNNFLQWMQIAGNLISEGQPVFNMKKLGEELTKKFGFDYGKLTEASAVNKSPEDILKNANLGAQGTPTSPTDINNPSYIPPAQRSGAKGNVPVLGGGITNG